jgi:hypothetical protein
MGEAKRRKQKLGDVYGQTPPVLLAGSRQLEHHVNQFVLSWMQNIDDIMADLECKENPSEAEAKILKQKGREWMDHYLQPYRAQDRHKLVEGILEPQYEEFLDLVQDSDPEKIQEQAIPWVITTITLYNLFKPYLSEAQAQKYAEPLTIFYEVAMEDAEAEGNTQQMEDLQQLFKAFLAETDVQDS